jgi:hypothetical protein
MRRILGPSRFTKFCLIALITKLTRIDQISVLNDWDREVHRELRWITKAVCTGLRIPKELDIVTAV